MLTSLSEEVERQARQHDVALAESRLRAEELEHGNKALSSMLEQSVNSMGKRIADLQGNNVEALNAQLHQHSRQLDEAAGTLLHLKDQVR
jgi:hypothetical protein